MYPFWDSFKSMKLNKTNLGAKIKDIFKGHLESAIISYICNTKYVYIKRNLFLFEY